MSFKKLTVVYTSAELPVNANANSANPVINFGCSFRLPHRLITTTIFNWRIAIFQEYSIQIPYLYSLAGQNHRQSWPLQPKTPG